MSPLPEPHALLCRFLEMFKERIKQGKRDGHRLFSATYDAWEAAIAAEGTEAYREAYERLTEAVIALQEGGDEREATSTDAQTILT